MNTKKILIIIVSIILISIVSVAMFYSYTDGHPLCVLEIIDIVDSQKKIISEPANNMSGLFEVIFDDPDKQKEYEKMVKDCIKII